MSIRLMTLMWDVQFPTQSQLLIALKLADYANDQGGSIFPSRNTIAELTQTSESTVKNVLRAFRECGLLLVAKEGGHGPKSTTQYEINLRLLSALVIGDCKLNGSSENLEVEFTNKGAEFDPLKGGEFDPLALVRGQSDLLRGQPGHAKGSAGYPQSTTIHQIDSSARERAAAEGATAHRAEAGVPVLIVRGDDTFQMWINWLNQEGHYQAASQMASEGKLVAYALRPFKGIPMPKLAPIETSPKYAELMAARNRVAAVVKPLTDITNRMLGEAAE